MYEPKIGGILWQILDAAYKIGNFRGIPNSRLPNNICQLFWKPLLSLFLILAFVVIVPYTIFSFVAIPVSLYSPALLIPPVIGGFVGELVVGFSVMVAIALWIGVIFGGAACVVAVLVQSVVLFTSFLGKHTPQQTNGLFVEYIRSKKEKTCRPVRWIDDK